MFNNYPRVISIYQKGETKYIIRDGAHRLACLSYLKFNKIPVCYESEYWKPSNLFLNLYKLLKGKPYLSHHKKCIKKENADNWPHVKNGVLKKHDALKIYKYFYEG